MNVVRSSPTWVASIASSTCLRVQRGVPPQAPAAFKSSLLRCVAHLSDAVLRALSHIDSSKPSAPAEAWVNVNRCGDWNLLHDHSGATWSGVFYAEVGESEDNTSGLLVLCESQSAKAIDYCVIHPSNGLLLLFPGWLPHAVLPFQPSSSSANVRVSYSFNLITSHSSLTRHGEDGGGNNRKQMLKNDNQDAEMSTK